MGHGMGTKVRGSSAVGTVSRKEAAGNKFRLFHMSSLRCCFLVSALKTRRQRQRDENLRDREERQAFAACWSLRNSKERQRFSTRTCSMPLDYV
ncbi:hypothetical protein MTO96_015968 [Rhipicephalus appendiculatus]